ncbi:polyketide synthase [Colletotrichum navitas]|uniref:Polyketide synthase n=1 Tax=Colletotrichum navitas TaxID=681940 RepID=A0AAD8V4Y3_9PEZI|nr:polyketide synthase [Colletotrichum navitas]KAK1589819.1 polyketide synthase [Colletotrichum navitas]
MGATSHEAYVVKTLEANLTQPLTVFRVVTPADSMDAEGPPESHSSPPPGRIAVVGMGGRGPDSHANDSLDQFWNLIRQGQDVARTIPEDRFDADSLFPPHAASSSSSSSSPCRSSTDYGCFLRDPGHFDARFFRLSPREATLLDPCSRLFLMAAHAAVEMSGYSDGPTRTVDPARIAVIYGQSNEDGYMTSHHERGCDAYTLQTVQRAFAPGRVAHHFGWEGPTWSVDSACSTSSSILHLATRLLVSGEVDMVVAGASNVISSPHGWCALSKSGVLSATGNCKPFRDDADGYCRGEFVGAVVLKRLEDAVAHNDNVLAVIAASGKNQSGNAASITAPDAGAQERLFRRVLRTAGVAPADVSYVEAHGTGTPVGDPCEMTAVSNVLARPGVEDDTHRLAVGAVKANIGHSEAASGIASLIKGVFMFRHQIMPPQVGMPHALHPRLPPLAELGIAIPSAERIFASAPGRPRRILLNNVDAAGGNSCLLLEDPAGLVPQATASSEGPSADHYVVAVSARTQASHRENKRRLVSWLKANPAARLADVAYTTTARRVHHRPFRSAYAVSSVRDLIGSLETDLDLTNDADTRLPGAAVSTTLPGHRSRPVVWIFPGQGSEHVGMGRELYHSSPVFRGMVDRCAQLCAEHGFPPFVDVIVDAAGRQGEGVETESGGDTIVKNHLALVTLELALAAFWRHVGVEPTMVIGHSLGEYAALHVAGVLSLADALHLVGHRARRLLAVCEPGACAMLAVSAAVDAVEAFLASRRGLLPSCTVACINGPSAVVVSGTRADVLTASEELAREGIRSRRLSVPYGYHSSQMDAVVPDLERLAAAVTFSPPKVPLASTLLASVVKTSSKTINHSYLARQTRCLVNFSGAVKAANATLGEGNNAIWLELGPRGVCASLVRSILPSSVRESTVVASTMEHRKTASTWSSVCSCLSDMYANGIDLDWLRLHGPRQGSLKLLSTLPTYAWDVQDYWIRWTEKTSAPSQEASSAGQDAAGLQTMHYTCAQNIIDKTDTQVTFRSRLAHPALKQIIDGHRVQGVPVCPGSVYCDAALAAASHVLGEQSDTDGLGLALADISLIRPLTENLVGSDGELFTSATVQQDLKTGTAQAVAVSFKTSSGSPSLARQVALGTCTVTRQDPTAIQAVWERNSYYVKSRMDLITQNAKEGRGHWLQPALFYSLLSRTFEYHNEGFKAITEAFVSPDFQDATAHCVLAETAPGTRFVSSPYWGEALVHLAGFLANCRPRQPTAADSTICIMHSIGRIERVAALEPGKAYTTYARICTKRYDALYCDVFAFDAAGTMVLSCVDMCFRELSTTVMAQALGTFKGPPVPGDDVLTRDAKPRAVISAPSKGTKPLATYVTGRQDINQAADEPATRGETVDVADAVIRSIAVETGCHLSRLADDQDLVDLGVDSIMAIEIVSSVKATTGCDLAPSFLLECHTIGHLRSLLRGRNKASPSNDSGDVDSNRDDLEACKSGSSADSEDDNDRNKNNSSNKVRPQARVTLLSKCTNANKQAGQHRLYLMADGFGSVSSYVHLLAHRFPADLYGIDSPYLRCPLQLTPDVSIESIARLMVDALLQHQPHGPFTLGGFSGGGILAYEMTRQLIAAGHEVRGLLIIDMRCPLPLPEQNLKMPSSDRAVPPDIIQNLTNHTFALTSVGWNPDSDTARHLVRFLDTVARYCPPMPPPPQLQQACFNVATAIVWCVKGMITHLQRHPDLMRRAAEHGVPLEPFPGFMQDAKLGHLLWSLLNKTPADLGPNGWENYVNNGSGQSDRDILCLSVDANHQEVMQPTYARKTAEAIGKALGFFSDRADERHGS